MDDRLKDLRVPLTPKHTPNQADVEAGEQSENPTFLAFLKKLKVFGKGITNIRTGTDSIKQYTEKLSKTGNKTSEQQLFKEIDGVSNDTKKSIELVKEGLIKLARDVEAAKDLDDADKEKVTKNLVNRFDDLKESVKDFKNAQISCQANFSEKLQRQFKIVTQDEGYSRAEIEQIMGDPAQMQDIIQQKMMGTASLKLKNAVRDIHEKLEDIKILAENVNLITELLENMSLMINDQGQIITNTANNITQAANTTNKGLQNLADAKEQNDKYKKRQWWFCCCIIMLLIVVGSPILITVLIRARIF